MSQKRTKIWPGKNKVRGFLWWFRERRRERSNPLMRWRCLTLSLGELMKAKRCVRVLMRKVWQQCGCQPQCCGICPNRLSDLTSHDARNGADDLMGSIHKITNPSLTGLFLRLCIQQCL